MTLTTNLAESQQEGMPEFYELTMGTTVERYTSWAEDLLFQGYVYKAVPIKRSGFSFDVEFGTTTVRIQAIISDILKKYIANFPLEPVYVKMYRALRSDLDDFIILAIGVLKNVSFNKNEATAVMEANADHLTARIPNVAYQSGCNHIVFDGGCNLQQVQWKTTLAVTVIANTLQGAFDAQPDGYWTGGKVVFEQDSRLITNHVGDTIALHVPFDARLKSGDSVDAYPGCDGKPTTCQNKFDNFDNYLGFPHIPSSNPVMYGIK